MPKAYEDESELVVELDEPEDSSLIPAMVPPDPYVVVRFWDHGVLYTCSLCGNYPDFPTREAAELHVKSHKA